MCLAIPGKVVSIVGDQADIDFGGVIRNANIAMVEADVGDWVIIHAGFAIEKLDEDEAQKTLELWREVLAQEENL
ncbi:MAG: hydrogenase expression/formation protein HypC [Candidatus Methanomethylophilaceae archaeon]|nr:hydrogenase expression/formation protein HypC [Candidatus Methanomethylophilaceae archaeon]MDI3541628.1 hydrogenase expression/formation protein HypC [Candidatus Methanomethylophilaceae archaeon]HIJ00200.1 HypC/HybG/HupF family hydrogenase formation chaperone [Candidatus Methanomethylophilaceae archaeon]